MDTGILTLLDKNTNGGFEVLGLNGEWVVAPCVPGSAVVNIGELMAKVSSGRFQGTYHRVRNSPVKDRYSGPLFFEPGVEHALQCEWRRRGDLLRRACVEQDESTLVLSNRLRSLTKSWHEGVTLSSCSQALLTGCCKIAEVCTAISGFVDSNCDMLGSFS